MAYSDLLPNQTVTFTNLQSGVTQGYFTAKTTIPTSNECITKTDANTYVNINTASGGYASKALNQLVYKADLVGTSPTNTVVYVPSVGVYPLSGNTTVSSTGTITNYFSSSVYLFVVFNSAGLNSGTVSNDNMVIVPQPAVSVSGTITSYGQLLFGTQYILAANTAYTISIQKGDLLGGGSTLRFYYSTTPSTITAVAI